MEPSSPRRGSSMRITRNTVVWLSILILLVLLPIAYVEGLNVIIPHRGLRLEAGFIDSSFDTHYSGFYQGFNLTSNWQIDWTLGQGPSSGVNCTSSYCLITAQFSGERQGLQVSKPMSGLNTENFPFFLMNSTESTADFGLTYSIAVIAGNGTWFTAPFFHAMTSMHTTSIDLRTVYSGPISRITIRLTDDFYPQYEGGIQSMTIYSIAFASSAPSWQPSASNALGASISGGNGTLTVSGTTASDLLGSQSSIVSAQRTSNLTFDPTVYDIMSVELRTLTPGVVARIVLWEDATNAITIFSTVISDTGYHKVLVDLAQDNLSPTLFMIELSWTSSTPSTSFELQFQNLVFYENAA
jgi:hypothetical protein